MVAHGHRVKTDCVHELDFSVTLIGRIHKRALVLIARINDDDVFTRKLFAKLGDFGCDTRHTTETFSGVIVFGGTGSVIFTDRFDA